MHTKYCGFKTFKEMLSYIKKNKIKNIEGYGHSKKEKHYFKTKK